MLIVSRYAAPVPEADAGSARLRAVTEPHPLAAVLAAAATGRLPPRRRVDRTDPAGRARDRRRSRSPVTPSSSPTRPGGATLDSHPPIGAGGGFGGVHHPTVLSWLADADGRGARARSTSSSCAGAAGRLRRHGGAGDVVRRDDLRQPSPGARALAHRRDVVVLADEIGLVSSDAGSSVGGRCPSSCSTPSRPHRAPAVA